MENHDPIYDQFRNAAENSEQKAYPDMDKVWNRVEGKLDNTMLTKENHLWKKIAVAASVILTVTLLYQSLSPESEQTVKSKNAIVVHEDSEITVQPQAIDEQPIESDDIKPEAAKILEQQIKTADAIVAAEVQEPISTAVAIDSADNASESDKRASLKSKMLQQPKFEAVSVVRHEAEFVNSSRAAQVARKDSPLLVVDGKAIKNSDSARYNRTLQTTLRGTTEQDETEISVLSEPLYIINSVYYSEAELFGPNPTSPYSPLNKQEIETITILQAEQATAIYGERGKKGVVIITTKNKKPLDAGRK